MSQEKIGYQNPKLYHDIEKILFQLLNIHKKVNKVYRITILEKEVYPRLVATMQSVINIGINKKNMTIEEIEKSIELIIGDFQIIKSFLSFLVLNNHLQRNFYFNISGEIEKTSMQVSGWKKYLRGIKNV